MNYAMRKQLTTIAERTGSTLVDLVHGGKHLKATFRRGGLTARVTVSVSPSDQRAFQNQLSDVRRQFRGAAC